MEVADLAPTVNSNKTGGWRFDADQPESLVTFVKSSRAREVDGEERWEATDTAPTLSDFDLGSDIRTTVMALEAVHGSEGVTAESELLPLGLDSHRYRCCGNGVVSGVSEWIGERLAGYLASMETA